MTDGRERVMATLRWALACVLLMAVCGHGTTHAAVSGGTVQDRPLRVVNGGFETAGEATEIARGWTAGIGGGAQAVASIDANIAHSGVRSLRLTSRSPQKAFVYLLVSSAPIAVQPQTTCVAKCWVRARSASSCYFGVAFRGAGGRRRYFPNGDCEWRQMSLRFTVPEGCSSVTLQLACDDVTASLWVDDVTLEISPLRLSGLAERRERRPFPGVFPRPPGPLPQRLIVFDAASLPEESRMAAAALQGIVNRTRPRLYVINPTNPAGQDEVWLRYMQERGYTGREERLMGLANLVTRFRSEVTGAIVIDPELPGSINAAFMLAGLLNALPVSPALQQELGLPIRMDLRGRWKRNVEAYRFVYERYWPRMNHHILSWEQPRSGSFTARDYMVAFNVFTFWVSSHSDRERGADPDAEELFLHELLANTPANVPVMGWPASGDGVGLTEYEGVRLLSEYGKFVPGTGFCSNLTIHAAIRPNPALFRRRRGPLPPAGTAGGAQPGLDTRKVYLSLNVLDSGDALWYWQLHQRTLWADPVRGATPVGWCLNPTLTEALPLVMQWYVEHATPNDTFVANVSGLGYMNTQVYAARFRRDERERIWREYVGLTADFCRRADLHGIALYNGGWNEPTPPNPELFHRFTSGIPGLEFILADLGRHDSVTPERAAAMVDGVPVFHTLTRYQVWSSSAEVGRMRMEDANRWLLQEIREHTPAARPAFMSAMAISWYYSPSWFRDLAQRLPSDVVLVGPEDLARNYRAHAVRPAVRDP